MRAQQDPRVLSVHGIGEALKFGFADDARQNSPTRPEMRPLAGVGGVFLDAHAVGPVERAIDALCSRAGFPPMEEFKWSPGRELWMWRELRGDQREAFFLEVLTILARHEASVVVVAVDVEARAATGADTPERDATRLFLERASNRFLNGGGVLIVDRPSGNRAEENKFLTECVEYFQEETSFVVPDRFSLPVLVSQSRLVRMLQVADLVTSCSLSHIAGESTYSPPVFERIVPLLASEHGRVGGVGLKIHPDLRYVNLYHWLANDEYYYRQNTGFPLPMRGKLYVDDPEIAD